MMEAIILLLPILLVFLKSEVIEKINNTGLHHDVLKQAIYSIGVVTLTFFEPGVIIKFQYTVLFSFIYLTIVSRKKSWQESSDLILPLLFLGIIEFINVGELFTLIFIGFLVCLFGLREPGKIRLLWFTSLVGPIMYLLNDQGLFAVTPFVALVGFFASFLSISLFNKSNNLDCLSLVFSFALIKQFLEIEHIVLVGVASALFLIVLAVKLKTTLRPHLLTLGALTFLAKEPAPQVVVLLYLSYFIIEGFYGVALNVISQIEFSTDKKISISQSTLLKLIMVLLFFSGIMGVPQVWFLKTFETSLGSITPYIFLFLLHPILSIAGEGSTTLKEETPKSVLWLLLLSGAAFTLPLLNLGFVYNPWVLLILVLLAGIKGLLIKFPQLKENIFILLERFRSSRYTVVGKGRPFLLKPKPFTNSIRFEIFRTEGLSTSVVFSFFILLIFLTFVWRGL